MHSNVIRSQTTAIRAPAIPCKVLGIVLLNRVCGQVYWIRWTISSAGATSCAYVFPRGYRRERWSYRRVAEWRISLPASLRRAISARAMRCCCGVRTVPSGSRRFWDARFAGSLPFPSTMPPAPILRAGSARRCARSWCCVRANGPRFLDSLRGGRLRHHRSCRSGGRSRRSIRPNAFVRLRFSHPIHSKSFSPPAPRPSPREWCSPTPTWSATWSRSKPRSENT